MKRFAPIGPSRAVQYSLCVSAYRQHLQNSTIRNNILGVAGPAPWSPVEHLVPIPPLVLLSTVTPSCPV
jgi:hypothetical protein